MPSPRIQLLRGLSLAFSFCTYMNLFKGILSRETCHKALVFRSQPGEIGLTLLGCFTGFWSAGQVWSIFTQRSRQAYLGVLLLHQDLRNPLRHGKFFQLLAL